MQFNTLLASLVILPGLLMASPVQPRYAGGKRLQVMEHVLGPKDTWKPVYADGTAAKTAPVIVGYEGTITPEQKAKMDAYEKVINPLPRSLFSKRDVESCFNSGSYVSKDQLVGNCIDFCNRANSWHMPNGGTFWFVGSQCYDDHGTLNHYTNQHGDKVAVYWEVALDVDSSFVWDNCLEALDTILDSCHPKEITRLRPEGGLAICTSGVKSIRRRVRRASGCSG